MKMSNLPRRTKTVFVHCLLRFQILLVFILAYVAWWSTSISDQRQFRTVLLLDRRRRTRSIITARIPFRQLSNHIETLTIASGKFSYLLILLRVVYSSVLYDHGKFPDFTSSQLELTNFEVRVRTWAKTFTWSSTFIKSEKI